MWVSYAELWVAGIHNFVKLVSVRSHYPFNRLRVLHCLPNRTHFSGFLPILTKIFPVWVLFTPIDDKGKGLHIIY